MMEGKLKSNKRKHQSASKLAAAALAETPVLQQEPEQSVSQPKKRKKNKTHSEGSTAFETEQPVPQPEAGQPAASSGTAAAGKGKRKKTKKEALEAAAESDHAVSASEPSAAALQSAAAVHLAAGTDMPRKKKKKHAAAPGITNTTDEQGIPTIGQKSREDRGDSAVPAAKTAADNEQPAGKRKLSKKSKQQPNPVIQQAEAEAQAQAQASPTAEAGPEASPVKAKKKRKSKQPQERQQQGIAASSPDQADAESPLDTTELPAKPAPVLDNTADDGTDARPVDGHQAAGPGRMGRSGSGGRSFQRVNAMEWLGQKGSWDNSYGATFGNAGWGAKAQEQLGQVRGKDFRHEKTKKKRGTYRGGAIDGSVRSFKYESDNE